MRVWFCVARFSRAGTCSSVPDEDLPFSGSSNKLPARGLEAGHTPHPILLRVYHLCNPFDAIMALPIAKDPQPTHAVVLKAHHRDFTLGGATKSVRSPPGAHRMCAERSHDRRRFMQWESKVGMTLPLSLEFVPDQRIHTPQPFCSLCRGGGVMGPSQLPAPMLSNNKVVIKRRIHFVR